MYLRMLVMTIISFYTSRIVLEALGVEDFGIYNIVGGIVVLFSFLNNAMANATQRFISFELGKDDTNGITAVFQMSINCHIIISIVLFILSETIGLWFVNTYLNIPPERFFAANIVYQFSILTFIINIIRVPFYSVIISYERMSFFAYISIVEALLKLGVVYLILYFSYDKLIQYSIWNFVLCISIFIIYIIYTYLHFPKCRYSKYWDKGLFMGLMSFSGWSMVNGSSNIIAQQGSNILLNIFYGVSINAGYGIATQVSNAIYQLVSNFQVSFQPQIVKLYAHNEIQAESILLVRSSKLSFFLLFMIFLPVAISLKEFLSVWLMEIPPFATSFTLWMLLFFLIDAIQGPFWMAIYATGNIRGYSIWTSIITFLNLPLSLVFLSLGFSPVFVVIIRVGLNIFCSTYRCFLIRRIIDFPIKDYLRMIIFKVLPVVCISVPLALFIRNSISNSIWNLVIVSILNFFIVTILIYVFGLTRIERDRILAIINQKLHVH